MPVLNPGYSVAPDTHEYHNCLCHWWLLVYINVVKKCWQILFINYVVVVYTCLGIAVGGTWGLYEGLMAVPTGESRRLKLNTVINSCTRRGPFLANNLAVLGL